MARNDEAVLDSTVTESPAEGTEAVEASGTEASDTSTDTSTDTESVEKTDEEKAAEAAAAKEAAAKAEADKAEAEKANEAAFNQFKELAEKAARDDGTEGRDTATGHLSDGQMAKLREVYGKISGVKWRKAVREYLDDLLRRGFTEDSAVARSALFIKDGLASVKPAAPPTERKPADPTRDFLDRAVPLYLAPAMLVPGEGVSEDWQDRLMQEARDLGDQVQTWIKYQAAVAKWNADRTEDTSDEDHEANKPAEPEVSDLVKAGWTVAQGKAVRTRKTSTGATKTVTPRDPNAKRGDIKAHIQNAIKGKASGTFMTIGEICKVPSEDYPEGHPPSSGAVDAALWPRSGKPTKVEGVQPGNDGSGRKGVRVL